MPRKSLSKRASAERGRLAKLDVRAAGLEPLMVVITDARSPPSSLFLKRAAVHWHPEIRRAVAAHPHTDVYALARLARDEEDSVRCTVAQNSATAEKTLIRLAAQDPSNEVRQAAAHALALKRATPQLSTHEEPLSPNGGRGQDEP